MKAEENVARGTFVDIHDIGGVDPNDYDVLITDVNDHTLHNEISDLVGIPYLKEATKEEADKKADSLVLSTAISTVWYFHVSSRLKTRLIGSSFLLEGLHWRTSQLR